MHCQVSFAAVERQSAIAACLPSLIAFLNFDDIIPVLFEQLKGGEGLAGSVKEASDRQWQLYLLPDGLADRYAVEAAFRFLQTYSLIQWRDDRGGYVMHAWGQDRLEVEQQRFLSRIG